MMFRLAIFALWLITTSQVKCFAQNYCEYGVYGSLCSSSDNIHSVSISGTNLNVSGNYCTNQGALNVTIFPDTGSATCTLVQGLTYQLNVQSTANRALAFWLDYNHNFIFEANEFELISNSSVPNGITSLNFNVAVYPYFGKTRMRIMSAYALAGISASDACTSFFTGEIEDYTLFIAPNSICQNPLNAGISVSSKGNLICAGNETVLSLQANSVAGAITYQWESSADSLTWTNLPSGGSYNDTLAIYSSAYFRCAQTCSGSTYFSVPVHILVKPFYNCYCASAPSAPLSFNTKTHIGHIRLSNLSNGNDSLLFNSPQATGAYSDFTHLSPASLTQGMNYSFELVVVNNASNGFYPSLISAFIDYNHNGIFDEPYEKIFSDASVGGKFKFTTTIQIPSTSQLGITRMRIIAYNEDYYKNGACFGYYTGETEDYLVAIQSGMPCTLPVSAGTTLASQGPLICAGKSTVFSLSGASGGSGQTYDWQFSMDSLNWYSIPNANHAIFEDSIYNSYYYRCKVTCGTSVDFSVPYKVQLLASNQCYCAAISATSRYYGSDIGKFSFGSLVNGMDTLPVLANNTAKTVYSNFTNLPIHYFNRGSSYISRIKQITSNSNFDSASARIFIDYNQDGIFNFQNESVYLGKTSNSGLGSSVSKNVLIPSTALTGITGLRAMIQDGSGFNTSCGGFYSGEVEDYLIYIDFASENEKLNQEDELEIFPNPASEKINIIYPFNNADEAFLQLSDVCGRSLLIVSLPKGKNQMELDLTNYQNGIYLISFMVENRRLLSHKLLILH